jgi:hypothetical protein
VDFRKLRRTLQSKLGAEEDTQSDHVYYYLTIDNSAFRVGKISHSSRGSDQVTDFILSDTARRMKLDKTELSEFVDCTIDKNRYLSLWHERQVSNG